MLEKATAPPYLIREDQFCGRDDGEPLRYKAITGLTDGQLAELTVRVHEAAGLMTSAGRPYALGLFRSVALVVTLMRKNVTHDVAAAFFGVSQPTVSRRWDLLRPLIGQVLAVFVPDPGEVVWIAVCGSRRLMPMSA
jgi:hypothetical protein